MPLPSDDGCTSQLRHAWQWRGHLFPLFEAFFTRTARVGVMSFAILFALAQSIATACADEIEIEHLFGFAAGSDVGLLGEREFEGATTERFGKRAGRYTPGERPSPLNSFRCKTFAPNTPLPSSRMTSLA